jgi:hypothetical protein
LDLSDPGFTAQMERDLDGVADSGGDWVAIGDGAAWQREQLAPQPSLRPMEARVHRAGEKKPHD